MSERGPEIDIDDIENKAIWVQNFISTFSKFKRISRIYTILSVLIYLTFIVMTVYILLDSDEDCGYLGSLRRVMISYLVTLCLGSVMSTILEIFLKSGTILKHYKFLIVYIVFKILYMLAILGILISASIVLFGDSDCSEDFYGGFVLTLLFIIDCYLDILLITILIIAIVMIFRTISKKISTAN